MKKITVILIVLIGYTISAQTSNYNTKKGFAVEGYDVVSYFNDTATKGNKLFAATYEDVKYQFSSQNNLDTFLLDPTKYIPQYGGYCAYAVAVKSKKVSIDPETFEIRNGKLYLFYNSWGTNTLDSWKEQSPDDLLVKADKNWKDITQ